MCRARATPLSSTEGGFTIALRRSTQSDDSPAKLASELATARAAYETRKENVIGRATARVEAIYALRNELAAESSDLQAVIQSA